MEDSWPKLANKIQIEAKEFIILFFIIHTSLHLIFSYGSACPTIAIFVAFSIAIQLNCVEYESVKNSTNSARNKK